ncbi:hypothetical protein GCM10025768_26220 [Microbacterium pseudoresistens]|uniref:DUF937 domain-containing protein n=1 Tax=Microbacterium pseudoresistens TaxID=640634 RepID=A0A7Y9EVA4_9MICO|nr:DUF937 domain-containing protein [Microbacterium pseudoresistens]NYD53735.1 hypothetical protein [Microbacterium pseudoresistens]
MDINDIMKMIPIDDIAEKLGVDKDVATQAVQEGSQVIVGGLAKQAETPEGSSAIEQALSKHGGFSGAGSVADVDEADGEKIINHVFGGNQGQVAQAMTNEQTTAGIDFGKLLPILAPIVMGLIANHAKGQQPATADASAGGGGGGGIGDMIGGLLGGGGNNNAGGGGGGLDIGGILGNIGGMLGGGNNSGGGSGGIDIGGLLGGLLGGKK